jgi:hypothetical protein
MNFILKIMLKSGINKFLKKYGLPTYQSQIKELY